MKPTLLALFINTFYFLNYTASVFLVVYSTMHYFHILNRSFPYLRASICIYLFTLYTIASIIYIYIHRISWTYTYLQQVSMHTMDTKTHFSINQILVINEYLSIIVIHNTTTAKITMINVLIRARCCMSIKSNKQPYQLMQEYTNNLSGRLIHVYIIKYNPIGPLKTTVFRNTLIAIHDTE